MVEETSNYQANRHGVGGHHKKSFIVQAVNEVIKGKSIRMVCEEYGVNRSTLNRWVDNIDFMTSQKKLKRPVSNDIKRSVVRSIQGGRLTVREAQIAYGIKSKDTIKRWVRELESENVDLDREKDDSMKKGKSSPKVSKADNADVQALQKALEEAQLKIVALNTLIDVAENQLQINIRKKPGAKQSSD